VMAETNKEPAARRPLKEAAAGSGPGPRLTDCTSRHVLDRQQGGRVHAGPDAP
jgi:hypothetical protein